MSSFCDQNYLHAGILAFGNVLSRNVAEQAGTATHEILNSGERYGAKSRNVELPKPLEAL
jgi:hypothetical protein